LQRGKIDWAIREIFERAKNQKYEFSTDLPKCANDGKFDEVQMVLLGESVEAASFDGPFIVSNHLVMPPRSDIPSYLLSSFFRSFLFSLFSNPILTHQLGQTDFCMCMYCMHARGETRPQGEPVNVINVAKYVMN
jgi:hypothetical protein